MRLAQPALIILSLLLAGATLFAALWVPPPSNAAKTLADGGYDMTGYKETKLELDDGTKYSLFSPQKIEGEVVDVYFAVTDQAGAVEYFGKLSLDVDELSAKSGGSEASSSIIAPAVGTDLHLPDGRVRRFVSPSMPGGLFDVFTYDSTTGKKTDMTQVWVDEQGEYLRYSGGKTYYSLDYEKSSDQITNSWRETGKGGETITIDPLSFLPVD
jgi:hypothetical protein